MLSKTGYFDHAYFSSSVARFLRQVRNYKDIDVKTMSQVNESKRTINVENVSKFYYIR